MNRMIKAISLGLLLSTAAACSKPAGNTATDANAAATATADGIDGTWKADLSTVVIDEKPSTYLLKDGTYTCSTCIPPLTVAADGKFHAVKDRPYFDSMSVTVVDDKTVKFVRRKGETEIGESTNTLSADGKTNNFEFKDMSVPGGKPVTGKGAETRVADGPAGAHALSGQWKTAKYDSVSDEGLTFTFKTEGDMVHLSSPSGISYEATLGGPAVPIKGDTGGTMMKVERVSPTSIRETSTRDGKVVSVATYTANAGKLDVVQEDKRQGSTMKYSANRS